MSTLTLEVVRDAVKGSAAAFRCRRRLQPAGGEGDKVFPPTFAGAVYAIEQRRIVSADDRRHALRAVARVRRLLLGRLGTWQIGPVTAARPPWNLRPETWTAHPGGATHWATVTPIVYDRHPKTDDRVAYEREVAAMIAQGCVRIGLPEPRQVVVTPVSAHLGVPLANTFPRLRRKDGSERRHVHTVVVFDRALRGPVVLGAGRYRGYGVGRAADHRDARGLFGTERGKEGEEP